MESSQLSSRGGLISSFLLFSSVVLFVNLLPATSGQTISVPLTRYTTANAGVYGQPVVNYYATIDIGTPAKKFNVQFDTSAEQSFVPEYILNPIEYNLHHDRGYLCDQSSTCVKQNSTYLLDYQKCILQGAQYEDLMSFNYVYSNRSRLDANATWEHKFLAINEARHENFKYMPIDGVLSLAPTSYPAVDGLLVSLQKAQLIAELEFSIWFNSRYSLDKIPLAGGELFFGGSNPARYVNSIVYHNLTDTHPSVWSMRLNYVNLGNEILSCAGKKCHIVVSTGLNEIHGPQADVQRLYEQLNTTRQGDVQIMRCSQVDQKPNLTFNIEGTAYTLTPSRYIKKYASGGAYGYADDTCYVAIQPSLGNRQQRWTLGTNFLEDYYTTFDMARRRIGFATIKSMPTSD